MKTDSTYYSDLITKYFSGEATPEEIRELEAWVKADQANREQFQAYHKVWKAVGTNRNSPSLDISSEWNNLKSRIFQVQGSRFEVQGSRFEVRGSRFKVSGYRLQVSKSKVLNWSYGIAAIFLLLIVPAFLMYRSFSSADELQMAASGNISEFTLPDGTKVTLNNGATLTYPSEFTGGLRKISLNGEAWFEVTHDASHPFVVNAGKTVIQVLGTSFSVNTKGYRNCNEIILATGKVKVFLDDKPDNPVFLSPGEKAIAPSDGRSIIKSVNEDENFLAWKTKHIIFSNTTMNEVAALLEKVYDVRIRFSDNRLSGCKITATFDKQSLESVLNVIKATLDLQIRYAGSNIELSGAGCN